MFIFSVSAIFLALIFGLIALTLSYVAVSHDEVEIALNPDIKTGDILLLRHSRYTSSWMVGFVSHMCVIWNHSIFGPLVIDMNPEKEGAFKKPLPFDHVFAGPSVVAIRLADFIKFYPGDVYIRSLKKSLTLDQEAKFIAKLGWAFKLEYMSSIKSRDVLTWLTLALSHFTPQLSRFLSIFTSLGCVRTSSFCTEMIAELFIECGILQTHSSHLWSPLAWVKGVGAEGLMDDKWHMQKHLILKS